MEASIYFRKQKNYNELKIRLNSLETKVVKKPWIMARQSFIKNILAIWNLEIK